MKMEKPILVIMAAGLGSRYGGLKQMDSIGKNGELIIDYSVYDAIQAGFEKVVFIINHKIEKDFKEIVGKKLNGFIGVEYAFQELSDIPESVTLPNDRVKPLGTAHAIYSARDKIDGPFCVINADDYYGRDAFESMYNFLSKKDLGKYDYSMVGYSLKNTVTDNGYVSRGICDVDNDMMLHGVTERTHIEKVKEGIIYKDNNNWEYPLDENAIVSMNFWGFTPSLIDEIKDNIADFLLAELPNNPLKCEYFLPFVVDEMIKQLRCSVKVMHTDEKWYGVTYAEDKENVVKALDKMTSDGKYPNKLWEK